jgi:hypothetical protein
MMDVYIPQKGDRVRCDAPRGGLKPYTGTVNEVWQGFVKVIFDRPQGPGGIHAFALTSPGNLVPIEDKGAVQKTLNAGITQHPITPSVGLGLPPANLVQPNIPPLPHHAVAEMQQVPEPTQPVEAATEAVQQPEPVAEALPKGGASKAKATLA